MIIKITEELKDNCNKLSKQIIGAAIEVHKILGPGLLESSYEECLCHELILRNLNVQRQLSLPIEYKGIKLDCSYGIDLLINDLIIIELKSVENIDPIHLVQLLTYLRLSKKWLGLLINFNVILLKDGIRRLVNG